MVDNQQRSQGRVDCDIILNKVESGHTNICRATNLSLGGMRLQRLLEAHNGRDNELKLQFELPGDCEPIFVAANKVYEDDEVVGVKFTNISHSHFVRLRSWLRDQAVGEELPRFSA